MVQAHYEARHQQDVGDPLFYFCEHCKNSTFQTVIEIVPIRCEKHSLIIGFDNVLHCDTCNYTNHKKRIEIYPC